MGIAGQAGRSTTLDDFEVRYYDGDYAGTFDPAVQEPAPLTRAPAAYRTCRPGQTCSAFQGCCTANTDCGSNPSCLHGFGNQARLGTNVDVCIASHCANQVRDAGEPRADCGGPDCAPCSCTSSIAPGAAGYCSSTCLCGIGESPCSADNQCLAGNTCDLLGVKYGGTESAYACTPFHCSNRVLDAAAGETGVDCGGSCGSCYSNPTNGSYWHCEVWQQCASGNGPCRYSDECQPGLVCGTTASGARFGLPAGTAACVAGHCRNNVRDAALGETGPDCGGECGTYP